MTADPSKIFVVHGRNEQIRADFFSFLRAIGLNPIEWSQAVKMTGIGAPYIGEVLDAAFDEAQAVIVLLTGDDEARLNQVFHSQSEKEYETKLTPQARPNVLFEAGMAFGRNPNRTILVELGAQRPFSDVAGRHIVHLNNTSKKRQELAQRLETAGCPVELTGTDWHQIGNFDSSYSAEILADNVSPEDESKTNAFLPSEAEDVLKLFGETSSPFGSGYISSMLKLNNVRAAYWLDYLTDKVFIEYYGTTHDGIDTYELSSDGRAYLVENNIY